MATPEATPAEVRGRVEGTVPPGATVEAVLRTVAGGTLDERVVARGALDDAGRYRLRYERAAAAAPAVTSLAVRLRTAAGAALAESVAVLSPAASARIDLRAPRGARAIPEQAAVERRLASALDGGVETLDGLEPRAVAELAEWLDLEPDRLAALQRARALAAEIGVPVAVPYALGRAGVPLELAALAEVPAHALRTTVEEAVASGIVDGGVLDALDSALDALHARAVDAALLPGDAEDAEPGLAEILAAAELPAERVRDVLRRRQAWDGPDEAFWAELADGDGTSEGDDDGGADDVRVAVELARLVGVDPPTLRRLHALRREGRWETPADLAGFGFDDWCELLGSLEPEVAGGEGEEDGAEGDAAVEARAGEILDTLEEAFPSAFIRRALVEREGAAGTRRVLERAPDHDFHRGSIRERAAAEPQLLEGLEPAEAEAALDELEAAERLARVTDGAEEVSTLLDAGIRSAHEIAAWSPRRFIGTFGEALGGRPQAARVHAQAQQVAAASRLATVRLLQAHQQTPFVLGGAPLKDVPDARALFGALGACGCAESASIYSPAAYLVDLLASLERPDPERIEKLRARAARDAGATAELSRRIAHRPLQVLLARRPDLAQLPLSAENTSTALPYIDLVNELLEARITGSSAAHDTGKLPGDVLRAVPQHVDAEAYRRLQQAVHPLVLPYHAPLAAARAYLAHLGVTRLELLRVFGAGDPAAAEAILAESLGMPPEELAAILRPLAEAWRHLGFDAEQRDGRRWIDALAPAPALLDALGIELDELAELARTRFVNPDGALVLQAATVDCAPEQLTLVGLDEARVARLWRMVRLRRRLGWSVADLDRALRALGAAELDAGVLQKLAQVKELARRLDLPVADLLVLWAPLDTWGDGAAFERLFSTRAVAWRTEDVRVFELRVDRSELAQTGESLDPVAPALLAAFRVTGAELAAARAVTARRGAPARLDLAGLSAIRRVVVLARALGLRIEQLDGLLRLVPGDADPFGPGDPAGTLRFVEIAREVEGSEFNPERLLYLFRHEIDPRRDLSPTPAQLRAVVAAVRRALVDAAADASAPADAGAETLRQKLALILDAALLGPALEILDPRTPAPASERRRFFDRHLARLFPAPAAIAAQLFGDGDETAGPGRGDEPGPGSRAAAAPAAPATPVSPTPLGAAPGARGDAGGAGGTPADAGVLAGAPPGASAAPGAPPDVSAAGVTAADAGAVPPEAQPEGAEPLEAAAADDPAARARALLERRWVENVRLVLAHLLPHLRARQTRGAVVQSLSDALGLSAPATGRLLDGVLRSRRRAGEPLRVDFLALLGTGLTGAYFANPELRGEPAVTRVDPELAFSWMGAPPAPGVPGRGFSARWTGQLLPRATASHVFYVRTDGPVRVSVRVGDTEHVLVDRPGVSGRVVEHASAPVALAEGVPCALGVEYRNLGAPARLSVEVGTSPGARQPLATVDLLPADGLRSLAPVEDAYRRLHKAALLLAGFGFNEAQLASLAADPPLLDLDALPQEPGPAADGVALFRRWRTVAALVALRRKLPSAGAELLDAVRAATLEDGVARLLAATGWDRETVEALVGPAGFALGKDGLRPAPGEPPVLLRIARAVDAQRRIGVPAATLFAWARAAPDAGMAAAVVQAVKSRYDERRWLEVARTLNDPLRVERRDALVAYLVPRMRSQGVRTRAQLFEYFLIDVEMSPCMLTSRVRQAISAVQTFIQRCLMNLEANVHPRLIDDGEWKWLKSYRVWEANRKIFLYPENWIQPELRDDKSPLFVELERAILQQEINAENVEAAFSGYVEGLDRIGRLDVRGVWFERRGPAAPARRRVPVPRPPVPEWDQGTYHVFARTFNAPHDWYYRRLERGRTWTPWEKVDCDIEGDQLVPVVFQRRLHLFWTVFREAAKPTPPMRREIKGSASQVSKDWEIHLACSVYDRGRWSRKRMSSAGAKDVEQFITPPRRKEDEPQIDGSTAVPCTDYTLRVTVADDPAELVVFLHRRRIDPLWTGQPGAGRVIAADAELDLVARFELAGSGGELALAAVYPHLRIPHVGVPPEQRRRRGRGNRRRRPAPPAPTRAAPVPFAPTRGGLLDAPAGYRVDGMHYVPAGGAGALLALRVPGGAGTMVALGADRRAPGVRILPVVDPSRPTGAGLYPLFFQDRLRSLFARPITTGWRPPTLVAQPLIGPYAPPGARFGQRRIPTLARRSRRGGRSREELEAAAEEAPDLDPGGEVAPEILDAREEALDQAWHPDDAAEARRPRPRRRGRPPARRAPPPASRRPVASAPLRMVVRRPGYREERLRFTAFEHPDTARFVRTLRSDGIDALLSLTTSRPEHARDHDLHPQRGWSLRPRTEFERRYAPGPLVDARWRPHLDVDFEAGGPYAQYNWELFFHAPFQVALRLARDGRHEEAQRWFHYIFDPTTDVSAPAPQRYWRFAPFHENSEYAGAREMMALLSYGGRDPQLLERQAAVVGQVVDWWEKPFSPHVIARLRTAAYQKAVVMAYIDNLIAWGDKLFRRDTMESIHEATQLYLLAGNILGPRPARLPPLADVRPVTFAEVRGRLDLFANWEVQLENKMVRRPFRIAARPERSGAASILGMSTQYFCVPPNPQMDKAWDAVADRLFKIRNCMNIQGVVRQLPLFEPPLDPGLLARAAAAGVDLASVIARLNAPPPYHRFRVLAQRAIRLAEELRTFGGQALRVLERRDAEGLAALRASSEALLLDAIRDIRRRQVKQVEEEVAELGLEREHVELQIQQITKELEQLMNPQEDAKQRALSAGQIVAAAAEGADLVAKVLYAIPDFQAGSAGGFSSPFATLQLGGQMFGDISEAFASSLEKLKGKSESEAGLAEAQAEYQRRRTEWQNELELLEKEKAGLAKRLAEAQIRVEIAAAELRRNDLAVENARKVEAHLREKFTSEQLYGWMLGQLSAVHLDAYRQAYDAAQLAQQAYRFERGDEGASFIQFSYWDSLKKGLFAGERLLLDLRRMEAAHLESDRRDLEITRRVSLREDDPAALQRLVATGACEVRVTEALLDGDFAGHYLRRIRSAALTVVAASPIAGNVNATLTLVAHRTRTDPNASGAYAQSEDAEDSRFVTGKDPERAVATSRPGPDAGVFELRFDDERYLPFEGAGAISTWRIALRQADNAVRLSEVRDVVLTLAYTARLAPALEAPARASRERSLARGGLVPPTALLVSVRHDLPALWAQLAAAAPGQEVRAPLGLDAERLPGRLRGLDVRVERVHAFAHPRGAVDARPLRVRVDPPRGTGAVLETWTRPWAPARALEAAAEVKGAPGAWSVAVAATAGKLTDLFEDVCLVLELRARKE
jgi:hypothetical protein